MSLSTSFLGVLPPASVVVHGHASGADIEDTVQAVEHYMSQGYKAIRAQCGIPGLPSTYGVGRGKMFYEPAEKDAPTENLWFTERYLNFVPLLFARLRKEFGQEIHLFHDAHHRLTPIEAARLGKDLEPFHLFWLEDPTPAELQESFRLVRRHTTTPLAVGEVFNAGFDCQQLIQGSSSTTFAPQSFTPAASPIYAKSPASLSSIKFAPDRTAPPTSAPSAWLPLFTLI